MTDIADDRVVTALLLTDAVVLPMSAEPTAEPDWFVGWLAVDDGGRIEDLGPGAPPERLLSTATTVRDVEGAFVAPGFVSAHSHLFTSGLRGIASNDTLYPWVRAMTGVFAPADAEDMYWSTLHGSLDFLANGITTAYNFTQSRASWAYDPAAARATLTALHPPEYVHRQLDGAVDAGLRVVHAVRLDDEVHPDDDAAVLATYADAVRESAARAPARQLLGMSIMGAVQWASGPRCAHLEARVMAEHGVTNQAHMVETAEGLDVQRGKFDWYVEAGALGPSMLFGHFIHPTDAMVDAVASSGSGMVWQPTSNGRLGSGLADVVRYREAGIAVGMGLDDQSCTDISDPFGNMRMGLYATRAARTDAAVMTPRDVLHLHTLASARVLGVDDRVGSFEVGKEADLVIVDPRSPDVGPVWDVYATYVMACGLRNLREVWVGGRLASRDGVGTAAATAQAPEELRTRTARLAAATGHRLPLLERELEAR